MTIQLFSDKPAENDELGRRQFAQSLAHALVSPANSDGLVVGIEGSWGSGKSSIIGFIRKALAEAKDEASAPVVVEFNPWMISSSGAMMEALLTQIAARIGYGAKDAPPAVLNLGRTIFRYGSVLKHFSFLKMVPGTGFLGAIAEELGEKSKAGLETMDDMEKLLPAYDVQQQKDNVIDALTQFNRPIVVIVDDVDRLVPDDVRSLVQVIKAVANFPKTTYVLAYDRDVVASALGAGKADVGYAYLEKIVQVAYPIPPLFQYQLQNILRSRLESLFTLLQLKLRGFEKAQEDEAIQIVATLMRHPRDIVRLTNRLLLSLPATAYEVNAIDVVVFEALSQRFPQLRERVHQHPEEFTGSGYAVDRTPGNTGTSAKDTTGDKINAWLRHLPSDEREQQAAEKACTFLFGSERRTGSIARLSLSDADRLARYFHMTSMDAVWEVHKVHALLDAPQALSEELKNGTLAQARQLLDSISGYLPSASAVDSAGCLKVLGAWAGKHGVGDSVLKDIATLLIKKADPGQHDDLFEYTVSAFPLAVAEHLLTEAAARLGIGVGLSKNLPAGAPLVTNKDMVERLLGEWCARVRASGKNGHLVFAPSLSTVLAGFAKFHPHYSEVYELVDHLSASPEGMKALLGTFPRDADAKDERYCMVRDAEAFINKIRQAGLASEYDWLLQRLQDADVAEAIAKKCRHTDEANAMDEELARKPPTS